MSDSDNEEVDFNDWNNSFQNNKPLQKTNPGQNYDSSDDILKMKEGNEGVNGLSLIRKYDNLLHYDTRRTKSFI
jgi:hypothetical protein